MKGRVEVAGESIMLYFEKNPEFAKGKLLVDFFDTQLGYLRTFCEITFRKNPNYLQRKEAWEGRCKILKVLETVQLGKAGRFLRCHREYQRRGCVHYDLKAYE